VHREAQRLFHRLAEQVGGLADPRERLVTGMLAALRNVRDIPARSSWFAATQRPIGGEMAEQSEVVRTLVKAFMRSLGMCSRADAASPDARSNRAQSCQRTTSGSTGWGAAGDR
jgi:hypothetical protein